MNVGRDLQLQELDKYLSGKWKQVYLPADAITENVLNVVCLDPKVAVGWIKQLITLDGQTADPLPGTYYTFYRVVQLQHGRALAWP